VLKSCSPVVLTWCEVHDCALCRASYSNSVFRLAVNSLAHDNYRLKHVCTATDRIPPAKHVHQWFTCVYTRT